MNSMPPKTDYPTADSQRIEGPVRSDRKLLRTGIVVMLIFGFSAAARSIYHVTSQLSDQSPKTTSPSQPFPVETSRSQTRSLEDRVVLVGSIEPQLRITVRAQVTGHLTSIPVDIGDRVLKSALIAQINDEVYRSLLIGSETAVKSAEVQLRISQAKSAYPVKQLAYVQRMAQKGYKASTDVELAETSLVIAQSEIELAKLRVTEATSRMEQDKIALAKTRIMAPLNGLVSVRHMEIGGLVSPGDPILEIVDISSVRCVVHITETDYERIVVNQTAQIRVPALPGERFSGVVVRKAPVLDQETRTSVVHIEIDNKQLKLKPGMHVSASILVRQHTDTVVVPIGALLDRDQPSVFVVHGTPPKAKLQEIQTGASDTQFVEVLSGIKLNDRVVTIGSRLIKDGQLINPLDVQQVEP